MKELEVAQVATAKKLPKLRRLRRWLRVLLLAVTATTWLVRHHVVASAELSVHAVGVVPVADCILVPGARIFANGEPYPVLVDRLAIAKELFGLGKAPLTVVRGRVGGGVAVVEVTAMRRRLERRGVPNHAIEGDPLGLPTVDALRRSHPVYEHKLVIVASNAFHAPRMVFLGRHC